MYTNAGCSSCLHWLQFSWQCSCHRGNGNGVEKLGGQCQWDWTGSTPSPQLCCWVPSVPGLSSDTPWCSTAESALPACLHGPTLLCLPSFPALLPQGREGTGTKLFFATLLLPTSFLREAQELSYRDTVQGRRPCGSQEAPGEGRYPQPQNTKNEEVSCVSCAQPSP